MTIFITGFLPLPELADFEASLSSTFEKDKLVINLTNVMPSKTDSNHKDKNVT